MQDLRNDADKFKASGDGIERPHRFVHDVLKNRGDLRTIPYPGSLQFELFSKQLLVTTVYYVSTKFDTIAIERSADRYLSTYSFGIEPTHSAAEFRRYAQWFKNSKHEINHLRPIDNGLYNRHESIIVPVAQFLQSRGVDFRLGTSVTDIVLEPEAHRRVSSIHVVKDNQPEVSINVRPNDIVIVSLGSVISGATSGTNTTPPSLETINPEKDLDENWLLWLELSTKDTKFGNAYNFCTRLCESRQESFTVTLKNPEFFDRFAELTGDAPGSGVFVTLKDSNWLLSLEIPAQPLFPDQPAEVQVFWGYSAFPEHKGDHIKKPMLECSGKEIMTEILHHLQFPESILRDSITIPCVMPRMAAALLPRGCGDRPQIIPEGMTNMALVGQFVDIPDDIVGTMDYYVRGAQIAVHRLMGLGHDVGSSKESSVTNTPG